MNVTDKYVLFWGSIFSNFAVTPYTSLDDKQFFCSEQEFMYRKAMLFDDHETAGKILSSNNPKEIKALGRQVQNYDDAIWSQVRYGAMFTACKGKYTNNQQAYNALMSYPGKIFVEASPYDKIWGIGLSEFDERAFDSATWQGQNLLGDILTKIRNYFETEH